MKLTLKLVTAAATAAYFAQAASADTVSLRAVGTWGSLTNYQKHEGPFFNELLEKASGGSIIGDIKPQTELGLKGFEIMVIVLASSLYIFILYLSLFSFRNILRFRVAVSGSMVRMSQKPFEECRQSNRF